LATLPKIGQQLTEENLTDIKSVIDKGTNDEHFQQARNHARTDAWENIGSGAAHCVDWLINKLNELRESE